GAQAPRMAVACVGCDLLVQPDAAAAAGRQLRERLGQLALELGIRLPVYVVFTKADQIPFFAEYVRNFPREQARDVLGATLPVETPASAGSYVDRETERLHDAFQRLFLSLAARRMDILSREHETDVAGRAYEFPREFRKLTAPVTGFLVELCRPSQLQVSPFLRGFYFTGVRAVVADQAAPAAVGRSPAAATFPRAVAATGIFHAEESHGGGGGVLAVEPASAPREYPQWLFAERLFREVIFRDDVAAALTQGGLRVNLLRRMALAGLAALFALVAAGFVVAWLGNRSLVRRVAEARRDVAPLVPVKGALPAVESLRGLERLGVEVDSLSTYAQAGAPLRLRWGLYRGDELLAGARRSWFEGFGKLLYGPAHAALLDSLRRLPDSARGADYYGGTYRRLKAHLITTTVPDSSTVEFLAPVLMSHWQAGRRLEPDRTDLVRRQFERYARELPAAGNPYSVRPDTAAVERARGFLRRYSGAERVYQSMLADASRSAPPVRFDRSFPTAATQVLNAYEVPGAFTRPGWTLMQEALKDADRYLGGESWVLGEDAAPPLDRAQVLEELRVRYRDDYVRHWRAFLDSASVPRYGGLRDAVQKLSGLSGNESPLLALFALASRQTAVPAAEVRALFQPLHLMVPDTAKKLVGEPTTGYVGALGALQVAVERVAAAPVGGSDEAVGKALESADLAKLEVQKVTRGFRSEADRRVSAAVQALMEAPISGAEGLLRNVGPAQMNAAGRAFCGPFRQLMAKFPFNRRSGTAASPEEVAKVFQPGTGTLWTLYQDALQKVLERRGREFVAVESGESRVSPEFVRFYNRAVAVSEALFPTGDVDPRLTFKLTPVLSEAVSGATLALDGQTARFSREAPETKPFVGVKAAGRTAKLTAQLREGPELTLDEVNEPWGVFRLFTEANRWLQTADGYLVEWSLRTGRAAGRTVTAGGSTPSVGFRLDLAGQAAVLRPGFFDGMSCSGVIVR
ncbi:MAG TPA: ImcF-related family protein, partial [Gemmatimonadales bacterium]